MLDFEKTCDRKSITISSFQTDRTNVDFYLTDYQYNPYLLLSSNGNSTRHQMT